MGLERIGVVLQDVPSVFDLDLFQPAREVLDSLVTAHMESDPLILQRARHMILDHTRASLFACLEGVSPGQESRNSVVRRLLRRAARQGRILGINGPFLSKLVEPLLHAHAFLLTPEQQANTSHCAEIIAREEQQFTRTLTAGLKILDTLQPDRDGMIPGEAIFHLHSDRGFPSDLAAEILAERGMSIDWPCYEQALARHRQVSRLSITTQFRTP
jgi:alanyl-tRNA synthetase